MSDDAKLIDPSGIPRFIGDLGTLDTDVMLLTADAGQFRASGSDVHTEFQGLSAFYEAPEAEQLFATTLPVKQKSDAFADDLEKVATALSDYSFEVQPLAKKLDTLKADATAFVNSVSGDDDWRKDQDKVDHNNDLWHDVNHTVAAFQDAERAAYNKIMALIGGTRMGVDDGSGGENKYGYRAEDLDHAEATPWGAPAEREYEGWAWLAHQGKQVWDGVWQDGVIGTIHGVGTLFGSDGWDAAGEAWKNMAKLGTASALTSVTMGTWWLLPEDKQPSWLRDSRKAYKETAKGFIAYDQWKTNPARAAGAVGFNVLTIIGTEGAGSAATGAGKAGAAARALSVAGKVGRAIDPMTYAGKAAKFAFVRVGDTFSTLKNLRTGAYADMADLGGRYAPAEHPLAAGERPVSVPESAVEYVDARGRSVYMTEDGHVLNADGSVRQNLDHAMVEPSAQERNGLKAHAHAGHGNHSVHGAESSEHSAVEAHVGRDEAAHGVGNAGDSHFPSSKPAVGDGPHSLDHHHVHHPSPGDEHSPGSMHADLDSAPPPGHGNKILAELPEARVRRVNGLITHVDGQPVSDYLDGLSQRRGTAYLAAKEAGTFPRKQAGACVGAVIDLRTGEVVEGLNGKPGNVIPVDQLHPTLAARYEEIRAQPPHEDHPLGHAEVKAANALLWERAKRGMPDGEEALHEMRASVVFPYLADRVTGVQGRSAPFCANCNHMLRGVPSSHGRFTGYPPSDENWIP
ncbi:YwqJ-related putative deaminase [Streptomyces griseoluteus]|uniref:YwqJ-related putative deaminase n=1 Tax=Streptomyces griseoluteus TaxID=29306 RepID=UPI00380E3A10